MSYKRIILLFLIVMLLAACGGTAPTAAPAAATAAPAAAAEKPAEEIIVGLITKTETNPFFVKMKEGAQAKADELGVKLLTGAGAETVTTKARSRRLRTWSTPGPRAS